MRRRGWACSPSTFYPHALGRLHGHDTGRNAGARWHTGEAEGCARWGPGTARTQPGPERHKAASAEKMGFCHSARPICCAGYVMLRALIFCFALHIEHVHGTPLRGALSLFLTHSPVPHPRVSLSTLTHSLFLSQEVQTRPNLARVSLR